MTAAQNHEPGLDDLGPDALLDALAAEDLARRTAERNILRIAYQWAVLHPATAESGTSTPVGASFLLTDESLGGDGCPGVAAYAAEPLALTLRISPASAQQLLADTLDLHHRLPHTWALVESLDVPAWKARQVATKTHTLPAEGAAWVDKHLAPRLTRCGARLLDTLTAQAIAEHDPPAQQTREEKAKAGWDVTLHTPQATEFAGTSELHAIGDTLALTRLYKKLCKHAAQKGRDGDDRPLGVRKAEALTDLLDGGETGEPPPTTLYLHAAVTDLFDEPVAAGSVERLGPVTTDRIHDWVGHSRVKIQPVIWMDTGHRAEPAVDQHDPPERIRETAILRDRTCVFPGCQVDARRCDLDHITPYDPHGPPGQTAPSALAALCRRHHRAKTSGLWRYARLPEGGYQWTGPGVGAITMA